MGQFQLDRLYMMFLRLLPSVSMPEHQVPYGSERHGGDGTRRVQFTLVVPVLPDVILTVFIPADTHNISDISVKKQTQSMWPCDRYRDTVQLSQIFKWRSLILYWNLDLLVFAEPSEDINIKDFKTSVNRK